MEVTTNKMGCFTVNWEIKNFSVLLPDITIKSADFKLMISEKSVWAYCCFYNFSSDVKIKVCSKEGSLDYDTLEISLFSSGREILVPKETHYVIPKSEIFPNNSASLPLDDTLTVCCRMWKATMETGKVRTVLHRDYFSWNIENFNPFSSFNHAFIDKHNLLFRMGMERNAKEGRTHTFLVEEVPNVGGLLSFLYIKPSISPQRGRIITKKSIYSHENKRWDIEMFATNGTTSDFQIQLDVIFAVHKEIPDVPSPVSIEIGNTPETVFRSPDTLKEDLLQLYKKALHSDATLNAEGKSFPVHKNILSTRSEVFRAMFEKDQMKESREGIVVIEDLDSQTVNRMLVYLYSDLLEDISWEDASALYYAADKYAVLHLKQKCTEILKAGLSVDNACDALVLADKHSDQAMMKSTVDFILDHKEVISSPKWEKLEESNSRLTSKIMKEILLKKWVK